VSLYLAPRALATSFLTAEAPLSRRASPAEVSDLVAVIYEELHVLARRQRALTGTQHTLDTTELLHETYLRLVDDRRVTRRGRAYFFAAAAHAMRRVLVDRARRRCATKRGGRAARPMIAIDDITVAATDRFVAELLDLDAALDRLAVLDARQAQVVECRYFGGLDVDETAEALGVSPRTVKAEWALARAWLYHALRDRTAG
jgi:RNA polymerase sigma-70 factor, ECF subfamily